ncbi:MAG: hypothetical protein NTX25_21045, partial [Proteobacteria bacterium]|nr:hypothetical protein [Pseudomonadota bacterium]
YSQTKLSAQTIQDLTKIIAIQTSQIESLRKQCQIQRSDIKNLWKRSDTIESRNKNLYSQLNIPGIENVEIKDTSVFCLSCRAP